MKLTFTEAMDDATTALEKLMAGDAHVPTALGHAERKRSFLSTVNEIKGKKAKPNPDDGEEAKQSVASGAQVSAATSQQLSPPAPPQARMENAAVGTREKADKADWRIPLDIVKAEPDKCFVFGWASIAEADGRPIVDKQEDVIEPADLENAAYDFVLYSRSQGDMHLRKGVGRLIESMVFTAEKQDVLGIKLGLQGWWVGFKVDDQDLWSEIKRGEKPEFSIGGKGIRQPMPVPMG